MERKVLAVEVPFSLHLVPLLPLASSSEVNLSRAENSISFHYRRSIAFLVPMVLSMRSMSEFGWVKVAEWVISGKSEGATRESCLSNTVFYERFLNHVASGRSDRVVFIRQRLKASYPTTWNQSHPSTPVSRRAGL